ncbi:MAG TPA: hypothetical protein VNQ34_12010 [Xanthobacteraceae bacterium]|nr:hypothetical protein [Xanthobacteraceae bacterium]
MPKLIGWALVIGGLGVGSVGYQVGAASSVLEKAALAMAVGFAVLATSSYYERRSK